MQENSVTYATILAVLIVYVILLIICIRCDRRDALKRQIIPVVDKPQSYRQQYLVTVETGYCRGAGTTAKVL